MRAERDLAIPMRDGVVLRADVYRPEGPARVPAVLARTPYDRSFRLTPPAALDPERATEAGLALVCQDVRGQYGSEGRFEPFVTEGADGVDTIDWIAAQEWSNGIVGMAGRSYTGTTQWLAAAEAPPQLKAICPVVSGSDFYNGWIYQGGAFQLGFNLFWVHLMTSGKKKISLDEQFEHLPLTDPPLLRQSEAGRFYREWLEHPSDDEHWRALAINRRYEAVQVPALNIGGWYDIFLRGTLENFTGMRTQAGSDAARRGTRLIVGPWAHGSTYGSFPDHKFEPFGPDQRPDMDATVLEFLIRHLDGGREGGQAPVRIFVMGENRWRDENDWPLERAGDERWFLRSDGGLSREQPAGEPPDGYLYDPRDPAPSIGGPTSLPGKFLKTNAGPLDQRRLEERDDVLVYSSPPLEAPVEVTGPLRCLIYAATSAPDTDFVVKLCDVDRDGVSTILAEGVLRARFVAGFEVARLVEPGAEHAYEIDLGATSNVFAAGHRIRVDVTSSSFPRFDRNPNTGHALGEDTHESLRTARQTIFHDAERASHVVLPVVAR